MNKYQSYIPSDIIWTGDIPEHWVSSKLKFVLERIVTGGTPDTSNDNYWSDDENGYNWISISDMTSNPNGIENTKKKITKSGLDYKRLELLSINTLIYSIYGSIGKVNRLKIESTIHQGILGLFPNSKIENRYLEYYLKYIQDFVSILSSSNTQENLNLDKVKNIGIVLPPLSEQLQIVQFLDEKTELIDKLISTKERKITLLNEQRTSLINQVVTKGLNPNVKTKDSGVEWIGEIPEHWKKTKVKYISNVVRGSILRPVDEPTYFDENGSWTYLNISDVSSVQKYLNHGKLRLSEIGSNKSRRVQPNNLIITGSGTVGKVFINTIPVCVHDGFIPLLDLKVNIDFMFYYLINPNLYVGIGKTNSQKNIYLDEVKEMDISIPLKEEQNQIVEYLDSKTKEIDDLIQLEQKKIDLLKEYRQSLISEVVTGKIKVTNDE